MHQQTPRRVFAKREPGLALRLVMSPNGPGVATNEQALRRLLDAHVPDSAVPDGTVHVIALTVTTLVWAVTTLVWGQPRHRLSGGRRRGDPDRPRAPRGRP